jgi:3-oxoadipate enol-lactonase
MAASAERTIHVRGQSLRVTVDGRDGAPWLAFSNSLATDLHLWDDQVDALAHDWQLLRYDFRGHGGSAPSIDPVCDINVLADDLLAVMEAVGATRVHHVGVSMGALAGLAAALQSPHCFASLIICNSRLRATATSAADLAHRADLALEHGMAALVEPTLQKWFGATQLPLNDRARERVAGMIAATHAASFAAYARGMGDYDLEQQIGDLAMPVHLFAGTDDGSVARDFQVISAKHPNVTCTLVEGAGHLPNLQVPTEFNSALAKLLSDLPAVSRC